MLRASTVLCSPHTLSYMRNIFTSALAFLLGLQNLLFAQTEVTIDNYSVNLYGQVQLRFKAALTNIISSKRSTVLISSGLPR